MMVMKEDNCLLSCVCLIGCCSCQTKNSELSCAGENKVVSNCVESKVPPIETGKTVVSVILAKRLFGLLFSQLYLHT